jgi:hypothetical protein
MLLQGSVEDPGFFIPDPYPNIFFIPDPVSGSQYYFFFLSHILDEKGMSSFNLTFSCSLWFQEQAFNNQKDNRTRILCPTKISPKFIPYGIRITDPVGKKAKVPEHCSKVLYCTVYERLKITELHCKQLTWTETPFCSWQSFSDPWALDSQRSCDPPDS